MDLSLQVATFEDGVKVWKDAYKTLAPTDTYDTAAQVERDFARVLNELRGTHSSKFTQGVTQSVVDFMETAYFPKQKRRN